MTCPEPKMVTQTGWLPTIAILAGLCAVTTAMLWPQVRHMTSVPPHHDPLFSIWRLAWIAYQLPRHPLALFDGNIFYPEQHTLAYSDAIILPGAIGALFIWSGLPPVVVYNLLVWLSFATAAAAMFCLVFTLTKDALAGWCAALIFAFVPYRFAHYVHLELLWSCWIPLTFLALHRTLCGHRRQGPLIGVFAACQTFSSVYYGLFLSSVLCVATPIMLLTHRGAPTKLSLLVRTLFRIGPPRKSSVEGALPIRSSTVRARKTILQRPQQIISTVGHQSGEQTTSGTYFSAPQPCSSHWLRCFLLSILSQSPMSLF